jgi:hypothetical protein
VLSKSPQQEQDSMHNGCFTIFGLKKKKLLNLKGFSSLEINLKLFKMIFSTSQMPFLHIGFFFGPFSHPKPQHLGQRHLTSHFDK